MRWVIVVILLVGCSVYAMGAAVTSQPPDRLLITPSDVLRSVPLGADSTHGSGPVLAPADVRSASEDAGNIRIQGPEPAAAFLAVSGLACIALLSWHRRLSSAIHRSRRRVYTIRRLA